MAMNYTILKYETVLIKYIKQNTCDITTRAMYEIVDVLSVGRGKAYKTLILPN